MLRISGIFSGFFILTSVAAPAAGQPVCTTNYYRFEEGAADTAASGSGTLVDSVDGSADGTPVGGPFYRADVLAPIVRNTGAPNTLSLEFNGHQSALFSSQFIFHQGGDATLEFFIKVPDQPHHSIFWTRADDTDANRFNITVNSNGGFGFDYRSPSGVLHLYASPYLLFFIPLDSWHHIAVVHSGATYSFYLDGVFQTSQTDSSPDLPTSTQWSISGRSTNRMIGLIDEIRLSACALAPNQFLISAACIGDLDSDGATSLADLTILLSHFGTPSGATYADGDLNNDGDVDLSDLTLMLAHFGTTCS